MRSNRFPVLALLAAAAAACSGARTDSLSNDPNADPNNPGGKADSPVHVDKIGIDHGNGTIPLSEVSGLALRTWKGKTELLAIGDSELAIAVATLPSSVKPSELSYVLHDVADLVPYPAPSQWEAIVCDSDGKVFVLEETPGAVHVFSAGLDELLHTYELRVEPSGPAWKQDLAEDWEQDTNSRGEGLALGWSGHFFVLKEKVGPGIVEFGPEGDEPLGLTSSATGSFPVPSTLHSVLVPLRIWKFADSAREVMPDLSDLFVTGDGTMYLVSGEGRSIGRVREYLDTQDDGKLHLDAAWKMPDSIANPERLVLLGDEEPWVASDSKSEVNLFELDRVQP